MVEPNETHQQNLGKHHFPVLGYPTKCDSSTSNGVIVCISRTNNRHVKLIEEIFGTLYRLLQMKRRSWMSFLQ